MSNWYLQNGKESDVVISTRVRLNRNLENFKFINKCSKQDKENILKTIENITPSIGYGLKMMKLKDIDQITKMSLVEKHLISPQFANADPNGLAILINNEENICIMINEDDHIKIQVFSEGMAIKDNINLAVEIDKKIEKLIDYAYNSKYGYLTSCPTDMGTGMKVSTMIHLPGLAQTGNINKIIRIVNSFGMSIKGSYKDGTESKGDIYIISNIKTLGYSEEEIGKNVRTITDQIIEQERTARKYLSKNGIELENRLYRAFGLLMYSKILSQDECIELLSDIKLGTDLGIIKELDDQKVKKLYLYTQNANMQKYFGKTMSGIDEEAKRSELIKQIINEN